MDDGGFAKYHSALDVQACHIAPSNSGVSLMVDESRLLTCRTLTLAPEVPQNVRRNRGASSLRVSGRSPLPLGASPLPITSSFVACRQHSLPKLAIALHVVAELVTLSPIQNTIDLPLYKFQTALPSVVLLRRGFSHFHVLGKHVEVAHAGNVLPR